IQCVDDEDRLADAHRNGESEIVAYTIDDGLRAAVRIAEDDTPREVRLVGDHRRNPVHGKTRHESERNASSQGSRAFAVRVRIQAPLLNAAPRHHRNGECATWFRGLSETWSELRQ